MDTDASLNSILRNGEMEQELWAHMIEDGGVASEQNEDMVRITESGPITLS